MALPESWSAAAAAALAGGTLRPGVVLRVGDNAFDALARLWSGAGPLMLNRVGVDPLDDPIEAAEAVVYQGAGLLSAGFPVLNQLINGLAERAEFAMSGAGVTGELAALASADASAVRGQKVNVGIVVFDEDWRRLAPPFWLWEGVADSVTVSRANDGDTPTRTISLSVGSVFTSRRRPGLDYFTDPAQRRRDPDDAFFDRVALYSAGSTKVWPQ